MACEILYCFISDTSIIQVGALVFDLCGQRNAGPARARSLTVWAGAQAQRIWRVAPPRSSHALDQSSNRFDDQKFHF